MIRRALAQRLNVRGGRVGARHEIDAADAPRMAAQHAPPGQGTAPHRTVAPQGLHGVDRACGLETTGIAKPWLQQQPIGLDRANQCLARPQRPGLKLRKPRCHRAGSIMSALGVALRRGRAGRQSAQARDPALASAAGRVRGAQLAPIEPNVPKGIPGLQKPVAGARATGRAAATSRGARRPHAPGASANCASRSAVHGASESQPRSRSGARRYPQADGRVGTTLWITSPHQDRHGAIFHELAHRPRGEARSECCATKPMQTAGSRSRPCG